ncbi:MAG: hypothetical protein PQJ61_02705 [Spirochaetales bacterium]|uniref:PilZ domain-containing protein n=1 Tax=Candidatus Thalassospirochaeta sargassi TaxID=3119039 RepID=A0AAJ1IDA6_9SPIO|nr:hypothetical protein [Spirochaetales bacterium]
MKESYTETVLQAITRTLNEGINERSTMLIIVSVIVLFVIVLTIVLSLRNRNRNISAAEASYQKLIRKYNLTILEMDYIEELAATLKKPSDKYHLLQNSSRFRAAEHKLDEPDEKTGEIIEGLKLKLGFISTQSEDGVISTSDLQQGQQVSVFYGSEELAAEIYSVAEMNITIKCPGQTVPVTAAQELRLIAISDGGFRVFFLRPDKIKGDLFSTPHATAAETEKINTKIHITAEVFRDDDEVSASAFKLVMLSENGAFIRYANDGLSPGDRLRIFFAGDHKKANPVSAEVVKISEEKMLAAVKFTGAHQ